MGDRGGALLNGGERGNYASPRGLQGGKRLRIKNNIFFHWEIKNWQVSRFISCKIFKLQTLHFPKPLPTGTSSIAIGFLG
jgi:hypothetical protein